LKRQIRHAARGRRASGTGHPKGILPAQWPETRLTTWDLRAAAGEGKAQLERVCGISCDPGCGTLLLTYRQVERTFGLITAALAKNTPDGIPSAALTVVLDDLLEASIPGEHKDASASLAADWTDVETFSRPPAPRQQDLR
jgi:hypothetical protein